MLIVILCVTLVLTVSIGQHHGTRRLTRGFLVSIGAKVTCTTTTGITDGRYGECAGKNKHHLLRVGEDARMLTILNLYLE